MSVLKTLLLLSLLVFSQERQVTVYFSSQDELSWSSQTSGSATNSKRCDSDAYLANEWFLQINAANNYVWKTVAIPEPHYAINLAYRLYFQYEWSGSDLATIQIDNDSTLSYNRATYLDPTKYCLYNAAGYWESGFGDHSNTWFHSASTATLKIGINFSSQDSKRLFVGNLVMLIYYCDYNCASCNGEGSN